MFSLTIASELGLLRATFPSVGEVVSSLGELYHSAELAHLIFSPVAVATAPYLRMDIHVVFLELDERGLFGRHRMTYRVKYSREDLLSIMTSKGSSVHYDPSHMEKFHYELCMSLH